MTAARAGALRAARARSWRLCVAALAITAAGCHARVVRSSSQARVAVRAPAPPPRTLVASAVRVQTPHPSVTAIEGGCRPDAQEQCDGLDDDCDGAIDEGCGYESGDIQITLGWDTGADLDLYVTDPTGYPISFQNPDSPSGGHLDRDARGACAGGPAGRTVENVYWSNAEPPSGRYLVEVHYWGRCGVAGPTQATLSVAVGGELLGVYNVVLNPRERQRVVFFDLP